MAFCSWKRKHLDDQLRVYNSAEKEGLDGRRGSSYQRIKRECNFEDPMEHAPERGLGDERYAGDDCAAA
jgi:hypothetical protein